MHKNLIASLALLVLVSFGVLGCTGGGDASESASGDSESEAKQSPKPRPPKIIRGEEGDVIDIGPSTLKVTGALKTATDPKAGGIQYEGRFVIIKYLYTNQLKHPVSLPPDTSWTLHDHQERYFGTEDQQGIIGSFSYKTGIAFLEEGLTANPDIPLEIAEAFQIPPDAEGLVLRGRDLHNPKASEVFEIKLDGL
jgi:hypothetical protein